MMANVNEQANRNSPTYALKYWIIIRKISVVCYFDSQFVCDWWVCTCQNGIFEPLSRYGYARPCMFVHMVLIHLSSVQIVNAIALMALSLNADFSHSQKQPKRNQFKLIKFPTVVQRAINYITHSVASLFSLCLQNENRRIRCFLWFYAEISVHSIARACPWKLLLPFSWIVEKYQKAFKWSSSKKID